MSYNKTNPKLLNILRNEYINFIKNIYTTNEIFSNKSLTCKLHRDNFVISDKTDIKVENHSHL